MVSEFNELRAPKMSYRYFNQIEMHPNYPYSSSLHTKSRRAESLSLMLLLPNIDWGKRNPSGQERRITNQKRKHTGEIRGKKPDPPLDSLIHWPFYSISSLSPFLSLTFSNPCHKKVKIATFLTNI